MERVEPAKTEVEISIKVWSVTEFSKRHNLKADEERRLLQLFGPFATAAELHHNIERKPRWR